MSMEQPDLFPDTLEVDENETSEVSEQEQVSEDPERDKAIDSFQRLRDEGVEAVSNNIVGDGQLMRLNAFIEADKKRAILMFEQEGVDLVKKTYQDVLQKRNSEDKIY